MKPIFPQVTFCTWFIIFALVIIVPMWLGSPKDFWMVGFGAVLTTVLACLFIQVQMVLDGVHSTGYVHHNPKSFKQFFLSFGIILFSFGGASTFPTIQNDMVDRAKFKMSVYMGFSEFCVSRCVIRTFMVLLMVLIGECVPHFDKLLALVGGSTVSLLTFVLPNLFYMKLCDQESPGSGWKKRPISLHMRVFMWELILIGLFGGIAATYSAFIAIVNSFSFSKACLL
ncbi:hypothetical protein O3M35_002404 [Rhynocoris fuscipes]|uniref:Amino acid transporter transmembrane domain-containing protein n=1 Tax=Rhynocoris fuscipes TaxID=488301 RepID=A0AAW1CK69_9HEMI